MNQRHLDILRHSLGLNRSAVAYRNYFVTGPGSTDYDDCMALVADGLMTAKPYPFAQGDTLFHVTEAGIERATAQENEGL